MPERNPAVVLGSQYYVNTGDTPQQIRDGIVAMSTAGLKLVRIFLQWTHVEPHRDHWDWSQYDALFDAAQEGGLGVIVTLTAIHPPGWMKISFGPQDIGPIDDPAYWEKARDYIRRVVARYGSHPALNSWILSNEPQLELPQTDVVLKRFQQFLETSYNGQIADLNRHSYQQLEYFHEVSFASAEGGFSGYTGRLNWINFMGYRLQEILAEIKNEIRATGSQHSIHVNPHGLVNEMYPRGQSIWAEGRLVDFMGCSAHPSWHSTRFLPERLHQSVALFADLMRGATRAPHRYFWVTELQGGTNIFSGLTYLGPTGPDLRSWIWESIGAGAKAVVFWCFNYRIQGYEAGEWSLVDQQGRPSRRLVEVTKIARFLELHQAVFAASRPARANVALLFSEATWKLGNIEGQGQDPEYPRNILMGADALVGAWMAFADAGISVDILDETDLQNGLADGYPLLVLPGCTALEDHSLDAIKKYVSSGGTLLADGLCGYKTPDGWLRDPANHVLTPVFGVSVSDIQAIPVHRAIQMTGATALPAWFLQIALEPVSSVQLLASFDETDPRPAVTTHPFGQGCAIRVGTAAFQHYFKHPFPGSFASLLGQLQLPHGPVYLANPSPTLRLRSLEIPGGALYVVVNSGGSVTAQLQVDPGVSLAILTHDGVNPIASDGGMVEQLVAAQDAVFLRCEWRE